MTKQGKTVTALALCLGMLTSMGQGIIAVKAETATTFAETKLQRGALEISRIFKDSKKGITAYYMDPDGINQKSVYNEKENKWETNTVKDSYMRVNGTVKYYSVYPTKKGYVEVAPDSSQIVVRNKNGKKLSKQKLTKIKGWKKKFVVQDATQVDKNRYLFICKTGERAKPQAVCVNIKTKKVIWNRKNVSETYEVIGDEVYFYFLDMKNIGKKNKKSDSIYIYDVKDGGKCKCLDSTIDATSIRNRIPQLHGQQTEDAYPITDQEIVFAGYKGKLYAAYMSGIYQYQRKTRTWKCLIDGVNNHQFSLGSDMTVVDLVPTSEKEFYVLASKGNYDGEGTDFMKYSAN